MKWVFGYGSLMWKVDFPFERKVVGRIKGYVRRFWQGSEDHRGVPDRPGRVVTLVKADDEECVWGVAYEIAPENRDEVQLHLDYREKDGYQKVEAIFYPEKMSIPEFNLTFYIGTEENPYFLGPAPLEEIALQISTSEGPSGTNADYLLKLVEAMRVLLPGVVDKHLFELETLVKQLMCS